MNKASKQLKIIRAAAKLSSFFEIMSAVSTAVLSVIMLGSFAKAAGLLKKI